MSASRGGLRPWRIAAVYLFDVPRLLDEQAARGAAEIYPRATNPALSVSSEQETLLRLFA